MLKTYNPKTMIPVKEAKKYAMDRRFEVAPQKRVRVIISRDEDIPSCAFIDRNEDETCEGETIDAFDVWDPNGISIMGMNGC